MTPAEALRPVSILVALMLSGALAGCGGAEGEPQRFQRLAEYVAAVDVPLSPDAAPRSSTPRAAADRGLRPARLEVAVMDPHDMWDARDAQAAGLRVKVADFVRPVAEAAAPVAATAALQRAAEQVPMLRPAVDRPAAEAPLRTASVERRMIQLGAFSSEAAAREAWSRLKGVAALAEASPVFQPVEVNGRTLTRLKVAAPADAAAAICRTVQAADSWCVRAG